MLIHKAITVKLRHHLASYNFAFLDCYIFSSLGAHKIARYFCPFLKFFQLSSNCHYSHIHAHILHIVNISTRLTIGNTTNIHSANHNYSLNFIQPRADLFSDNRLVERGLRERKTTLPPPPIPSRLARGFGPRHVRNRLSGKPHAWPRGSVPLPHCFVGRRVMWLLLQLSLQVCSLSGSSCGFRNQCWRICQHDKLVGAKKGAESDLYVINTFKLR